MRLIALFLSAFFLFEVYAQPLTFEQWLPWQTLASKEKLLQNVSPLDALPGTVVAASSRDNPNYYYHWVRDAALTMLTIEKLASTEPILWVQVEAFAHLTQMQQAQESPAGLGEVKYYPDGKPFVGPWGRPQNDGPALRAMALIELANHWLSLGMEEKVRAELYDSAFPTKTPIKMDLEYVSHNWTSPDFDLWEEVQGEHFFTRLMQRRALLEGAKLARRLGDVGAAAWYVWQAHLIEPQLNDHWDQQLGIYKSTIRRLSGIDYKQGMDASVVLGLIVAARSDDPFMSITDPKLASTVNVIISTFQKLYPINQKDLIEAPGIGRYPEDRYDGYETSRQGNPWFLITAGFAQYCFELSKAYYYRGTIDVNAFNLPLITKVMNLDGKYGVPQIPKKDFKASIVIDRAQDEEQFFRVIHGLENLGDMFLKRIYLHAHTDGSLSEQFSRYTGRMQGAENLTWSYANFLEAVRASNEFSRIEQSE